MHLAVHTVRRVWIGLLAALVGLSLTASVANAAGWPGTDPSGGVGWPTPGPSPVDPGPIDPGPVEPGDPVVSPVPQPEPATLLMGLVGIGLAGLYAIRKRKTNAEVNGEAP